MSRTASLKKDFVWTDDEVELLLTVTHQYKVQKLMETVDWEPIKIRRKEWMEWKKEWNEREKDERIK